MARSMKEMTEAECHAFLRRNRFGVMALADRRDAYALPLFYAYDGQDLFFHSRRGDKDTFLDATGDGCFVVVDHRSDDDWTSVQARGPVKRVGSNEDAHRGFRAIQENPFPPEFGVDSRGNPQRSGKGGYLWMLTPTRVSGRASRPLIHAG